MKHKMHEAVWLYTIILIYFKVKIFSLDLKKNDEFLKRELSNILNLKF